MTSTWRPTPVLVTALFGLPCQVFLLRFLRPLFFPQLCSLGCLGQWASKSSQEVTFSPKLQALQPQGWWPRPCYGDLCSPRSNAGSFIPTSQSPVVLPLPSSSAPLHRQAAHSVFSPALPPSPCAHTSSCWLPCSQAGLQGSSSRRKDKPWTKS